MCEKGADSNEFPFFPPPGAAKNWCQMEATLGAILITFLDHVMVVVAAGNLVATPPPFLPPFPSTAGLEETCDAHPLRCFRTKKMGPLAPKVPNYSSSAHFQFAICHLLFSLIITLPLSTLPRKRFPHLPSFFFKAPNFPDARRNFNLV